jgi:phage/plasmid primase-like uncharacterized protein
LLRHSEPSLSLRDGERGVIVRCWAGCDPRDVRATLCRLRLIGASAGTVHVALVPARGDGDDIARRIEAAERIWTSARDAAAGSPVARYLVGRGISLLPPPALRYAPSLRRADGASGPAMVARIGDLAGALIGVHRTWLHRGADGKWRRRDRAMLGRAAGGAVRLAPAAETLLIAEGIETALAAMTATAQPAWSALSTSGLIALELPPIVRSVMILADHDVSGAGERAARAAAARWLAEGRRVRIAMPPASGTDMADVLAGRGHAAITELHDAAT